MVEDDALKSLVERTNVKQEDEDVDLNKAVEVTKVYGFEYIGRIELLIRMGGLATTEENLTFWGEGDVVGLNDDGVLCSKKDSVH